MRKTHCLKIWPDYFKAVEKEEMSFQLRENDRDFKVGDILILQEWDPESSTYTRHELCYAITYILLGGVLGLPHNLCILGISSSVIIAA